MDPARPNRWPCLLVYARILSSFCSISAPFERSSAPRPFFFSPFLFFFSLSPPKNREIPFNSLLENEPASPLLYWVLLRQEWRTRAHYLLNFSWLKGLNSIFRFFLEIFYLSFFLSLCFFFFCFYFIRGARSVWRTFMVVVFLWEDVRKREKQGCNFFDNMFI